MPLIGRHAPDRAHEVEGPECQLEYLKLVRWLPTSGVNAGNPPPHGVVDARVRHQQVLGLLDPHGIIYDDAVRVVPRGSDPHTPGSIPCFLVLKNRPYM